MSTQEKLTKRFAELQTQSSISVTEGNGYQRGVNEEQARAWATSAMNLLQAAFGGQSPHCINFQLAYGAFNGWEDDFKSMRGIFVGAKSDFDGGYLFDVNRTISGEIFADFVSAAKKALAEEQKDVAAVLASAALEDALKRYAKLEGLNVDDQVMQSVVNALKSKGLVAGAQKSLLDTMPKIRDYAMHANWEKIKRDDVSAVIGFVESFLLTNFS